MNNVFDRIDEQPLSTVIHIADIVLHQQRMSMSDDHKRMLRQTMLKLAG
jgi:hypothetical protein